MQELGMDAIIIRPTVEKRSLLRSESEDKIVRKMNRIGELFFKDKLYLDSWLFDEKTELSNDRSITRTKLRIIKNRKNHEEVGLTYERPSSSSVKDRELLEISLKEGDSIFLMRKNKESDWDFYKKGKRGTDVPFEDAEKKQFEKELLLVISDIQADRIINLIDSTKIFRALSPIFIVFNMYMHIKDNIKIREDNGLPNKGSNQKDSHSLKTTKEKKTIYPLYSLSSTHQKMFDGEIIKTKSNFYRQELHYHSELMSTLGMIEDLRLTTRFFSQDQLKNGRDFSTTVAKFMLSDKDGSERYLWRTYQNGKPENRLVKPLWREIERVREEKNVLTQKNFFRMLDAFQHFKNESIATPEKIALQLKLETNTDNISAFDIWNNYWLMTPEKFNQGQIQGNSVTIETVSPRQLFVTENQIGIVMSVTKNKKGDIQVSVLVVDANGKTRRVIYDKNSFPKALIFRY